MPLEDFYFFVTLSFESLSLTFVRLVTFVFEGVSPEFEVESFFGRFDIDGCDASFFLFGLAYHATFS